VEEPYSHLFNVHEFSDVRQTEIHTAEPLVYGAIAVEVHMAIKKVNRHKSTGIVEIPTEFIEAGGRTIRSETHQLINSIWNKEEHPEEWKESIIAPVYKNGDKTDCSNYTGISLLSNLYKTFSSILLSRLTPYAEEITGDHQCGFRRNLSSTDNVILPSSNT
jgi:hypothetical protein